MESHLEIKPFYAKILLFGEYSLIRNSMALAVPYKKYSGQLRFLSNKVADNPDHAVESNQQIKMYLEYLQQISEGTELKHRFEINKLENDISNGLFFDSTIPQGYGLGSSGALVAALYYHYSHQEFLSENLPSIELSEIKQFLSKLESFFHGTSSGLDPLLAFVSKPILIRAKDQVTTTSVNWKAVQEQFDIFLIDTRTTGPTRPLVEYFMEQSNDSHYRHLIDNRLTPAVNQCIENLFDLNVVEFFDSLNVLSTLQLKCFTPMIVHDFTDIWQAGLQSGLFTLKLCGSGGGGYLLGFTRNRRQTSDFFRKHGISPVYVIEDLV